MNSVGDYNGSAFNFRDAYKDAGDPVVPATVSASQAHLMSIVYNATDLAYDINIDGVRVDNFKAADELDMLNLTRLHLATTSSIWTTTNMPYQGTISEVILFDSGLGTADQTTVNDYLTAKYFPPTRVAGDADDDGDVDLSDLSILATNWDATVAGGWDDADFDLDNFVGLTDLSMMASNWQYGVTTAVPEPATMSLLAIGGIALLRRRNR